MAARKSPVSTIDYTFSNVDWSALPADALAAIGQTPATQPAAPVMTMTPQEAEAAAAMALGQPTGRPAVEAALPDGGTGDGGGGGGGTGDDNRFTATDRGVVRIPKDPGQVRQQRQLPQSARDLIRTELEYYGLADEALLSATYSFFEQPEYDTMSESQYASLLMKAVKDSDVYKKRFGFLADVNKARLEKGQPILTEGEVVGMEESYRSTFKYYDLPPDLYDETSDFQKLIAGNVDIPELNARIQGGFDAVRNAGPDVVKQMETLYGVSEAKLAAYFLDPTKMKTVLIRQAEAAKVGAAASQGGVQLGVSLAEQLAAENVSPEQVRQSAAVVTRERQVQEALQAGETTISQEEALQADLGLSEAAAQRIRQRKARRIAEFQQGGGFAQTQTGITGLRTVGQ